MQYSQENTYIRFIFIIKLQTFRSATLQSRDSNIGKNLFSWTPANGCVCIFGKCIRRTFYIFIIQTNCIHIIASQRELYETKMVTCCVKGCWNQSRLNKNVSYHKIPDEEKKDIRDAWIKTIARPVLPKVVHVCSYQLKIHLIK